MRPEHPEASPPGNAIGRKLCPKIILEGTRLTLKTGITN